MKRELATVLCTAALSIAGCDRGADNVPVDANGSDVANEQQPAEPLNGQAAEMPPMIARSPAYRCADGNALYVDVLTDDNAVVVRDSRADVPVRLARKNGGEPFTGDGRTLSGTGPEVRYSSPDRPGQVCTEAEG